MRNYCKLRDTCFVFCAVLMSHPANMGFASDPENKLNLIPVPMIPVFEGRMDVPAEEIVGWMNAIEANLEAVKHDCRIKAELSSVSRKSGVPGAVVSLALALRRAKDPTKGAERYVSVRQNLMDNLAIATNSGAATDGRVHYDILRLGDRCYSCSVTAFDYHVGQIQSETEWSSSKSMLKMLLFIDPIRACTASTMGVKNGLAIHASNHNVNIGTVKAVVRENDYVHVLLELRSANSSATKQLAHTYKDEVPIQFVCWDEVEEDSGRPIYTMVTRSAWKTVGEGEHQQLLPYKIKGMVDLFYHTGEMEIDLAWILGDKVDDRLFEKSSLGKIIPAEDVVFGVPVRLNAMLQEASGGQ